MDDEIDFIDPEHFSGNKNEAFSHNVLIMLAMRKCIEAGSVELREGYTNTKIDRRGNEIRQYIPDTREVYINCVDTLDDVMDCIKDEQAIQEMTDLKEEFDKKTKELLEFDEKEWGKLSTSWKLSFNNQGIYQRKGYFTKAFPFLHDFIEEKILFSRKRFKILSSLGERIGLGEEKYMEA